MNSAKLRNPPPHKTRHSPPPHSTPDRQSFQEELLDTVGFPFLESRASHSRSPSRVSSYSRSFSPGRNRPYYADFFYPYPPPPPFTYGAPCYYDFYPNQYQLSPPVPKQPPSASASRPEATVQASPPTHLPSIPSQATESNLPEQGRELAHIQTTLIPDTLQDRDLNVSEGDTPSLAPPQTEIDQDPQQAEDFRNFSALLIRLSKALNLPTPKPSNVVEDPCFSSSEQQAPSSTALPTLPYLLQVIKTVGMAPSLVPATPKRAENLYKVDLSTASWLAKMPKANSVVTDAQPKPTQRAQLTPSDREGKKLDAMAKKFYTSACLFTRMAHCGVYMSVYQKFLWNKMESFLDSLSLHQQTLAKAFQQEALSLTALQKDLAKNTADASGKLLAGPMKTRMAPSHHLVSLRSLPH
nr:PREDICTED: uncharacterized protein LOC103278685 [Anolis carolinensis]|eukprot:XP_016848711.1 PREDICTED: uncharacterized protein LOC103278685 [Anolis carolinensis]